MANYSNEAKNVKPLTPTVAIWVLGTTIEHPVPDRVKPSFVMFVIFLASGHSDAQPRASESNG